MNFSVKQGVTWLIILLVATIIVKTAIPTTNNSNNKVKSTIATNWSSIKTNISGNTSSEKDDDYNINETMNINITVTLDLNGGKETEGMPSAKIVYINKEYGSIPSPTRTGYTFNGWYTEPTEGEKILKTTKVQINHNHTLYAHWVPNTYYVSYHDGESDLGQQEAVYDQEFNLKNVEDFSLSKDGYNFIGWKYTQNNIYLSGTIYKNLSSNSNGVIDLYAEWQPIESNN